MMYGFGDDPNPYSESVDLLEELVIEYITEMVSVLVLFFGWSASFMLSNILSFMTGVQMIFETFDSINYPNRTTVVWYTGHH